MNEQLKSSKKKKQGRSPSYPGIDLETAIARARTIKEHEGRNFTQPGTILKHWKYTAKSSPGLIALAALNKFGLVEDHGVGKNRKIKLSDLALRIILDEREISLEREKAIKEAALNPKIHRKLWEVYKGELPSNDNIKYKLLVEEKFTDYAAEELIKQFRRTKDFAKLTKHDIMSGHVEDKSAYKKEDSMPTVSSSQINPDQQLLEIPVVFNPKKIINIKLPYPLTNEEWGNLEETLKFYKGKVVEE